MEQPLPACEVCNNCKREKFDHASLKPDEQAYRFATWFEFAPHTGELRPAQLATPSQQLRGLATIELLRLNRGALCEDRKRVFALEHRDGPRSYRFLR